MIENLITKDNKKAMEKIGALTLELSEDTSAESLGMVFAANAVTILQQIGMDEDEILDLMKTLITSSDTPN